jgi:hypothetical protein
VKSAPIKGYRDLSQAEVDLMNKLKDVAVEVGNWVDIVLDDPDTDKRWANIAKTDLQKGFMALIRAVAKPETF